MTFRKGMFKSSHCSERTCERSTRVPRASRQQREMTTPFRNCLVAGCGWLAGLASVDAGFINGEGDVMMVVNNGNDDDMDDNDNDDCNLDDYKENE